MTNPLKMNKFEYAEWLHNTYEEISKIEGWDTQKQCKVAFKDLPEKNKNVMIKLSERIRNGLFINFLTEQINEVLKNFLQTDETERVL